MAKFRLSREFAEGEGPGDPLEIECAGTTVQACIDEVSSRVDEKIGEALLEHEPGERWRLAGDVSVKVNGKDVRELGGLGTPVGNHDTIEAEPVRGHGTPF